MGIERMKYFMSMWSPALNRRRNFAMNTDSARRYYRQWTSNVLEGKVLFKRGGKLFRSDQHGSKDDPDDHGFYIWGENMSDQELFKRRLAGTVDQEALED